MSPRRTAQNTAKKAVSLKVLADHLKLSTATVSLVLNESPSAASIPKETHDRVFAAARKFNYRPNFFARSLRKKRTYTIGVLIQDLGEGYGSLIISGIESFLRDKGYLYLLASHHHDSQLLAKYTDLLIERAVEGIIAIDTSLESAPGVPVVAIAGHRQLKGVTNIVLDHDVAALQALQHLKELGHTEIAFIRGQTFSSDSADRWRGICSMAKKLGIIIHPELSIRLTEDSSSPELGYPVTQTLLARNRRFTALFAFNDITAIGAMRALRDAGLRVPQDVSVIGFDDIQSAAFHNPSLTTVRQPLRTMGELAAKTLVERLESGNDDYPSIIAVHAQLIVRESTAPPLPYVIKTNARAKMAARR